MAEDVNKAVTQNEMNDASSSDVAGEIPTNNCELPAVVNTCDELLHVDTICDEVRHADNTPEINASSDVTNELPLSDNDNDMNAMNLVLNDLDIMGSIETDVEDGELTPGTVCRICYGNDEDEVLLNPCHCSGSVQYCHETCLMTWLKSGATTCEICKFPYRFQKYVKPWWGRTSPNITLWHLGWVFKELVVLDWFHFLETVFICISLVIINRMSSFDLVYQFALIGLVEFLYYTLNIFSCFFLLYYGRWARLNMKVSVLNYNDEHAIVPMGILYRCLDSYSSLLQRNKRLKQVVDQINEAEGED